MLAEYWQSFTGWLNAVERIGWNAWNHLTPSQYGIMLVSIGVFGWLLMKSSGKPV